MNSSVSIQEKKLFLEWLMSKFEAEQYTWLLEEIIEDERKLEIIRFVDSLEGCHKGIFMTFEGALGVRFLFFKGHIKTRDVYTAFHELQLHKDETYYIAVDFPNKDSNLLYKSVMEADDAEKEHMAQVAEDLLGQLLTEKRIQHLEDKINTALDHGDVAAFQNYTKQLKMWKKES